MNDNQRSVPPEKVDGVESTSALPEPQSQVLGELFREAIGIEKGLIRTFLDLRKNPRQVLEDYKAGDRRYVSPFRLLIASMSLWILINGFYIDWYTVWKDLISMIFDGETRLIAWIKDYDDAARNALILKLSTETASVMEIYCRFAGDLFSKWYVPYALISLVAGSILYTKRQGPDGLSLRDTMYILSYSIGANIPVLLLLSLIFWMHIGVALAVCFALLILNLMGYSKFTSFAPIRSFLARDAQSVEKKIMQSVFFVVTIGIGILAAGYMTYYMLY